MIEEIWKDIKDYEGLFQVSSNGVIRSLDRYLPMPNGGEKLVKGRIIKQYMNPNGYMIVILGKTHNDRKRKYVHRLVAKHFSKVCGDWFEECQIDHINTIRDDNRAINLKVCTASENANNPLTLKHQKDKIRKALSKPIIQFNPDGEVIQKWYSVKDVLLFYNVKDVRKIKNCTFKPWMKQIHLNKHIPQIFN